MKNLVFYRDSFFGKEIAFALNIKYINIHSFNKKELVNKKLFIENKEDEKQAKKKGLKRKVDYYILFDICEYLNEFSKIKDPDFLSKYKTVEDAYEVIKLIPNVFLTLPEMLIKVLYSRPINAKCRSLLTQSNIDFKGDVWGCCPGWIEIPFGNVLKDNNVYTTYYTRIIRLSTLNKTFCFCNLKKCPYYGSKYLDSYEVKNLNTTKYPKQTTVSIDKTCNLRCNSCRLEIYKQSKEEKTRVEQIADVLIEKKYLQKGVPLLAGEGEVFLSKSYDKIIRSFENAYQVNFLTNGTLFNKDKWDLVKDRFKIINVSVSIDAATKETYSKLRHGNFDILLKNLKMLGKLRKEYKIRFFIFNFVVQKDNYKEMKKFVKMAKKLNVDRVLFTRLNNWGTMTEEEYLEKSLLVDDHLDYDLYKTLQDPIFQDPIVTTDFFDIYMEKSHEYYKNK